MMRYFVEHNNISADYDLLCYLISGIEELIFNITNFEINNFIKCYFLLYVRKG